MWCRISIHLVHSKFFPIYVKSEFNILLTCLMQESITALKSEKVKREMLQGAELALGLLEGSMPVPFYMRPQLRWFLWTPWIKFGFPYSFPTPQIRKTADFSISDNGSSLWVQRELERGVGEAPPEKGAACRRRKSIAILSGIWLLQMQSFTLPTSKELKTDWKVLCTRSRNNNADLWTRVYERKNVHWVLVWLPFGHPILSGEPQAFAISNFPWAWQGKDEVMQWDSAEKETIIVLTSNQLI